MLFRRKRENDQSPWISETTDLIAKASGGDRDAISQLQNRITSRKPAIAGINEITTQMIKAVEAGQLELEFQEYRDAILYWHEQLSKATNTAERITALSQGFDYLVTKYRKFGPRLEAATGGTLASVIEQYNKALENRYRELSKLIHRDWAALEALHKLIVLSQEDRERSDAVAELPYPDGWNVRVATLHPAPPSDLFDFTVLRSLRSVDMPVYAARAVADQNAPAALLWLRFAESDRRRREALKGLVPHLALVAATAYKSTSRRQPA